MKDNLKMDTNPKGDTIYYYDDTHTYLINNEVKCVSGTTFIGRFYPPFEKEKIAYRVAKKRGQSVEEIIAEWDKKGKDASEYGTKLHEYAESILKGLPLRRARTPLQKENFPLVKELIDQILKEYNVIGIEKIVFSSELKIAGTIDVLLEHKETGDIVIGDWKSNEKIKKTGYNQANPPIFYLSDSHIDKYSLQLSLYEYILKKEKYFEDRKFSRLIYHIRKKITTYPLKYHGDDIEKMIEYYIKKG